MISTLGVKSIFCFNDISEYCIVEQKICGMETTKLNTMRNYLHLIAVALILLFVSTSFIGVGAPREANLLIENSNYRTENLRISTNGKIEFNDDYTDVIDMEEGAFLQISMSSFGIKRKILISKYHNKINRQYYEGYKELKFNPKGKEWLAKVLPSVVRDSGMDMENRVNRIYKKGGVNAFLQELEKTPNDYYRSRMVEFLLKNNDLKKSELQKLIREFPYRISSDRKLSNIYRQYNPIFLNGSFKIDERKEILQKFANGEIQCLIVSSILKQGIDLDCIDVMAFAGQKKATIPTLQRVGRGLRRGPKKDKVVIIEVANFCHEHLLKHSQARFDIYKSEDCFHMRVLNDDEIDINAL